MRLETCATAAAASARVAEILAEKLRVAVAERDFATLALSGGHTPAEMLGRLAAQPVAWPRIHVFQVDERIVNEGDDRSNMKSIRISLAKTDIPAEQIHGMPVETKSSESGIATYREILCDLAGDPPILDVVHLGLGEDGHTASLFSGDPAIESDDELAVTGIFNGLRRMTLTLNSLNRARLRVWLVTGTAKRSVVAKLLERDPNIIASRIRDNDSILVLDRDAAPHRL